MNRSFWRSSRVVPVLVVLAALVVIWYAAAVWLNAPWQLSVYERGKLPFPGPTQFAADTWAQERPVLPAPHQVAVELWNSTAMLAPTSKRSLVYHGWVTLSATLLGFVLGTVLGILLAVLIVHNRATDRSLMPWIIASQTIPILAIAPMIVIISYNVLTGKNPVAELFGLDADAARLVSKALISTYLSFFPVVVGMVKGFRSPEAIQLDLMRTYNASTGQVFWKLRFPIALPYLFTSMKVAVAASLVGAIVGELPTGAVAGLGARLLGGSYYGQTIQIWSALFAASILAGVLVIAVGIVERLVNARMGASMSQLQRIIAVLGGLAAMLALALPFGWAGEFAVRATDFAQVPLYVPAFLILAVATLARYFVRLSLWIDGAVALFGGIALVLALGTVTRAETGFWLMLVCGWLFAWLFAERLSTAIARGRAPSGLGFLIPLVFGCAILVIWEVATRAGGVPPIILPPPSQIWVRVVGGVPTLWADFQQTFKAVIAGYALGCGSGFIVAVLIDRSPFLKQGLLPLGNFVSALPIVGIAPILVMWFGFDWPSKAAVVVVMTFFPMLVNTVAGLNAAGQMERDMMRTYAASYWQTLFKLRLPAAAPFIFNALKINSTLALIGAIVAEFFGTPIVGMGFRISTEVGRMNVDMVWAEIAVAAVAGSAFYGVVVLIERAVTFWHPSVRGGRA